MSSAFRLLLSLLGIVFAPRSSFAHGGLPGASGFYSGAAHPFLAVEHFLILAVLGLMIGAHTLPCLRAPLAVLALGLAGGLVRGLDPATAHMILLGLTLLTGILVAAAVQLPAAARAILAGAIGWAVGTDTDVPRTAGLDVFEGAASYTGVFVGVFLICLNAVALASLARGPVPRIAVRMAGSSAAVIALMVLAIKLRPI